MKVSTLEASESLEKWRSAGQRVSVTFSGGPGIVDRFFCAGTISELTTEGFVLSWGDGESARFRVGVKVELSEDADTLRYLFNSNELLIVSAF